MEVETQTKIKESDERVPPDDDVLTELYGRCLTDSLAKESRTEKDDHGKLPEDDNERNDTKEKYIKNDIRQNENNESEKEGGMADSEMEVQSVKDDSEELSTRKFYSIYSEYTPALM